MYRLPVYSPSRIPDVRLQLSEGLTDGEVSTRGGRVVVQCLPAECAPALGFLRGHGCALAFRPALAEAHGEAVGRGWASPSSAAISGVCAGRAKYKLTWRRLDENPQAMRQRRETVEHPFGTLKMRMGATHFLMKRLPKVATEMALHVLAYNLTRVMNIVGVKPLLVAIRA